HPILLPSRSRLRQYLCAFATQLPTSVSTGLCGGTGLQAEGPLAFGRNTLELGRTMTDFYPLLVRAVSKLNTDRPQARQELYDHARKVLIAHLSGKESRASAPEVMREQIALEAAIRRVEAQSQAGQAQGMNRLTNSANVPWSDTNCELSIADRESPD